MNRRAWMGVAMDGRLGGRFCSLYARSFTLSQLNASERKSE